MSKLSGLITEVDVRMKEYNFGAVTAALHSFFLYDLCDLYLELLKPVVGMGAPLSEARTVAQSTLYTVLEHYLRYYTSIDRITK